MKEKDVRERLITSVTDDLLKSKFTSSVGQKAMIQRSEINNERMEELREVVREIGKDLLECGVAPKGMEYMGSKTVHIYKSEILRDAAFVTVSALDRCTFDLADGGLRELTGNTLLHYGKTRQKRRSGAS